jgi:hypothetical protein
MLIDARAAIAVAAFLACLIINPALADERTVLKPLDRPDPASVTVPKLETTPSGDYFFFHKTGVTYERAFSDLDDCRIYSLQARLGILPPRFVPLGSTAMKSEGVPSGPFFLMFGVVGALIAMPLVENAEGDNADTTNRRCMMYKGYSRYGTTREAWKQITAGTAADKLARMALMASAAEPQSGAIGP